MRRKALMQAGLAEGIVHDMFSWANRRDNLSKDLAEEAKGRVYNEALGSLGYEVVAREQRVYVLPLSLETTEFYYTSDVDNPPYTWHPWYPCAWGISADPAKGTLAMYLALSPPRSIQEATEWDFNDPSRWLKFAEGFGNGRVSWYGPLEKAHPASNKGDRDIKE